MVAGRARKEARHGRQESEYSILYTYRKRQRREKYKEKVAEKKVKERQSMLEQGYTHSPACSHLEVSPLPS